MIKMLNRFHMVILTIVSICGIPTLCRGNLCVIRRVLIAPKSVNAAASIGSVNHSDRVRLDMAIVDTHASRPGQDPLATPRLYVKATFACINKSSKQLKLRVCFPTSHSRYSFFKHNHCVVITDQDAREVFEKKAPISGKLIINIHPARKDPEEPFA